MSWRPSAAACVGCGLGWGSALPENTAPDTEVLVVEAGGTTLRAGRFDADTRTVRRRAEAPVPPIEAGETVGAHRDRVHDVIRRLADEVLDRAPEVVSVAWPGPIDEQGHVLAAPTMQREIGSPPYDLRHDLAGRWPGARVVVLNDLTAAGVRYAAAGLRDFVILTVGSGIGHKVFLDGQPRVGRGRGGEIGHLRVDRADDAPRCDCGGLGHLGAVASGRGAVALYARARRRAGIATAADERVDGHALAEAFRADDHVAVAAVREAAGFLGHALAAVHLDTGIEDFILVGGFAGGLGEPYRRELVAAATQECWDLGQDWDAMIRLGDPGDDAALIGCGIAAG